MTVDDVQDALDAAWDGGYLDDLCAVQLTSKGNARKLQAYVPALTFRARQLLDAAPCPDVVLGISWVERRAAGQRAHATAPHLRRRYHCPIRAFNTWMTPREEETA